MACATLLALSAHAEVNGDKFFNGLENGCTLSGQYQDYLSTICEFKTKKDKDYCAKGKLWLSWEYEVKTPKYTNKGDYSVVTTLFTNDVRWRGVPVAGIESWHNHDKYGFYRIAVLFDNKKVPDAQKSLIDAGMKFKSKRDDILETGGVVWNKTGQYQTAVCDWSK